MSDSRTKSRWGLFGASWLLALLLVLSTVWSHVGLVSRTHDISVSQGRVFADALKDDFGSDPQAILARWESDGLRWVGLVDPEGHVLQEAGTRAAPVDRFPLHPFDYVEVGSRFRFKAPPPRGPRAGPPHHRPSLVLEFEPLVAHDLVNRSRLTLAIAIVGALLLMGASTVFWRMSLAADHADRELAKHEHLASLGQMSAVLAHEIRNPLAALKGHAQLLAEGLENHEREQKRADRVVGEAMRLEHLTNSLLEFAKTAAIDRTNTDPTELLRDVVARLDPSRTEIDASRAPATWSMDRSKMHQVLLNIVNNALQAAESSVTATVSHAGGTLEFAVRDDGNGIEEDNEEALFQPFYTERSQGTGLGLAFARRIVQLHGGTITASNHPDGGAVFRVRIPEA